MAEQEEQAGDGAEDDDFYSSWAEFAEPPVEDTPVEKEMTQVQYRSPPPPREPPEESRRRQRSRSRSRSPQSSSRTGSSRDSYRKRSRWGDSNDNYGSRDRRTGDRDDDSRDRNAYSRGGHESNLQQQHHQQREQQHQHHHQQQEPQRALEVFGVYRGVVARVEAYGAFVKLEAVPRCRDGLAHVSQFPDAGTPPQPGQRVWVKVLSVQEVEQQQRGDGGDQQQQRYGDSSRRTTQKISLSLRLVDQITGEDLDPMNRQAEEAGARGGGGGGGGGRGSEQEAAPELYSIHHGSVAKHCSLFITTCIANLSSPPKAMVESFGCFVALDGFRKNGLVHISQLADYKVESTAEFLNLGDEVWVKVISLGQDQDLDQSDPSSSSSNAPLKISLSMKYCSQADGRDLDPGHANASQDAQKGRAGPKGRAPILVGDSLDPMAQFQKKRASAPSNTAAAAAAAPVEDPYAFVGSDDEGAGGKARHGSATAGGGAGGEAASRPPPPAGRGRGATLPSWMTDPSGGSGGPQKAAEDGSKRSSKKAKKKEEKKKSKKGKKHSKKGKEKKSKKKHKSEKKLPKKSKKRKSRSGDSSGSSSDDDSSGDDDSSDDGDGSSGNGSDVSNLAWGAAP